MKDFSSRFAESMKKDREKVLAEIRQTMHDRLPKRCEGHLGQQVVDALCDVYVARCLSGEPRFQVRYTFEDPDGGKWNLDREISYRLDPAQLENAEHYMFDETMRLQEEEFAQLVMVLT